MQATHCRHDISDNVWELLEPHLQGRVEIRGIAAHDGWSFLNAVFWSLRTGAAKRDFPPDHGG